MSKPRNTKTKREPSPAASVSSIASSSQSSNQLDLAKAATKLHHAAKSLRATAKKAKTFELQKLVKKSKDLRKLDGKKEELAALSDELAELKEVDTVFWSGRVLITKMIKAKLLPKHAAADEDEDQDAYPYLQLIQDEEMLGSTVLSEPSSSIARSKAYGKAKSKLISSKLLADQAGKFIEELKTLVGIESTKVRVETVQPAVDAKGKGKARDNSPAVEREWSGSEENSDSESEAGISPGEDDEDAQSADEDQLARIGKQKLAALGDLSQWDDMIGSDPEEESANSDSKGDDEDVSGEDSDQSAHSSDEEDSELESDHSSDVDDKDSDSEALSAPKKRKRDDKVTSTSKRKKKSADKADSSRFLPSLATGFVTGDRSDDDWSDAEADLADRDMSELSKGPKSERKNRMGQRARKAIWEKKYGKNANHLKLLEKEPKQPRKDTSRQPTVSKNGRVRPPAFQAPTTTDGGWGKAVAEGPAPTANVAVKRPPPREAQKASSTPKPKHDTPSMPVSNPPSAPANKKKEMEMHPSWIAKQKQKEKMAQVKPEGKKIVFD